MAHNPADQSLGDRESRLWIASRKYITGEIDITELRKVESDYTEDFNNAMLIISKRNLSHNLLDRLRKIVMVSH